MATPKFSSFVKQHGQLWCKGINFNIYIAREIANNDTVNTVYVEHDANVISLEQVKTMVITDHILMYNNNEVMMVKENITLNDIINGLNKLNFVSI